MSGTIGGAGGHSIFFVGYGLPAGNGAIVSRELVTTRPASERIPAGVRSVRIVAQRPGQPPSAPPTVTSAAHW